MKKNNYIIDCALWIQLNEPSLDGERSESKFNFLKSLLIGEARRYKSVKDKTRYWEQIEIAAFELTYNEFIQILIDNQYNRK